MQYQQKLNLKVTDMGASPSVIVITISSIPKIRDEQVNISPLDFSPIAIRIRKDKVVLREVMLLT